MASPEGSRPIVSEPLAARAAPLSKMSEKLMFEKMDLDGQLECQVQTFPILTSHRIICPSVLRPGDESLRFIPTRFS